MKAIEVARAVLWLYTWGFARMRVALDLYRRKALWQTKVRHASTPFVPAPSQTMIIAVLTAKPPAIR
jgi:hypothetical protein